MKLCRKDQLSWQLSSTWRPQRSFWVDTGDGIKTITSVPGWSYLGQWRLPVPSATTREGDHGACHGCWCPIHRNKVFERTGNYGNSRSISKHLRRNLCRLPPMPRGLCPLGHCSGCFPVHREASGADWDSAVCPRIERLSGKTSVHLWSVFSTPECPSLLIRLTMKGGRFAREISWPVGTK